MIPFTQYMRPVGRKMANGFDAPPEIEALAKELIAHGCEFEAEVLRTGEVSFEVLMPNPMFGDSFTLATAVVPNGPAVPKAVEELVREAHKEWSQRGKA